MTSVSPDPDSALPCPDPDCLDGGAGWPSYAEPEIDGDLHYHRCLTCGYEFNFRFQRHAVNPEGVCAVGIPEHIRRRASTAPGGTAPLLQIGRRPDA